MCPKPPVGMGGCILFTKRTKKASSQTSVKDFMRKEDGDGVNLKDFVNE